MFSNSRQFGHGYHAELAKGGREGATLHIERDLTTAELGLLARDLRVLSGYLTEARWLSVHLDVPLSASLAHALADLTQRYKLLTKVSVPPIRPWVQPPLAEEMMQPSRARLHVVPRQEENPSPANE